MVNAQNDEEHEQWCIEFAAAYAARSWTANPSISLEGHLWIWRHIVGLEETRPRKADFPWSHVLRLNKTAPPGGGTPRRGLDPNTLR